jgi:hypothetical protein
VLGVLGDTDLVYVEGGEVCVDGGGEAFALLGGEGGEAVRE